MSFRESIYLTFCQLLNLESHGTLVYLNEFWVINIIQIGFSKAVPEFLAELDEILGVMAVLFRVGKLGAASEA